MSFLHSVYHALLASSTLTHFRNSTKGRKNKLHFQVQPELYELRRPEVTEQYQTHLQALSDSASSLKRQASPAVRARQRRPPEVRRGRGRTNGSGVRRRQRLDGARGHETLPYGEEAWAGSRQTEACARCTRHRSHTSVKENLNSFQLLSACRGSFIYQVGV